MDDNTELEALVQRQLEFEKQMLEQQRLMAEVKADIEKKKKEIQEKKPLIIFADKINGNAVIVVTDYNPVFIDICRNIPGRSYNSDGKANSIPIVEWDKLLAEVKLRLPNAEVKYGAKVAETISEYLYAPDFSIDTDDKKFIIKIAKRNNISTYGLRDIPGAEYKFEKAHYTVPLSEAWRLYDYFQKRVGVDDPQVVWSESALNYTLEQVRKRTELDVIAVQKDVELEIPGFIGTLRNFQRVGIKFFDLNGARGICGDEMGIGKTPQMIALALLKGYSMCIVCPASLKTNWTRELKKFANEVPYVLQGSAPTTFDMIHLIKEKPRFVIINYDILGTSHVNQTITKDKEGFDHVKTEVRYPWVDVINLYQPDLIVLDEAHYIKNVESNRSAASRKLKAPHIIGLTGTPVLNRPGELWPILNLVEPETFPSYETFVRQYTIDKKVARNVDELRSLLKPLMIRRLKKDVIDEIPLLNRIDHFSELTPKAKRIYDKALNGVFEMLNTWSPGNGGTESNITNILVQFMRLKQICAIDKVPATADLATNIYDSTQPGDRPKKVLIFSQFKPTAYAIKVRLGSEALGFVDRNADGAFITVDQTERQRRVDQFQNDPNIHYLCVTEKTATEGHNITAAMAVLFNDLFWTPAAHQQAEGRAYMRTGDPHGIDSYYHIITGTIEDYILELLDAKLAMIEQVVEGVQSSRADASILTELIEKMKNSLWRK